ncbi:MAG TPA: multiheme c-type cytochrome [Vicinamibacterales bacterium]|nr:multiheme c-type cytochrome [Vicinamibacterales bacterium]
MAAIGLMAWLWPCVATAQVVRPVAAGTVAQGTATQSAPVKIPPALDTACARCHATSLKSEMQVHLREWARSPHAAHGIGCHDCHGGDPRDADAATAHASHTVANRPDTLHNVDRMCTRCHAETGRLFERNPHYKLIKAGDRLMPGCVACHGEEGLEPPSPVRVEAMCNQCHGAGAAHANPVYGAGIRLALRELESIRRLLAESRRFAGLLPEGPARTRIEAEIAQVEVAVHANSEAGHSGDDAVVAAQRSELYQRTVDIVNQLLQPPTPKR